MDFTQTFGTTASCTLLSLVLMVPTAAARPHAAYAPGASTGDTDEPSEAEQQREAAAEAFSDGQYQAAIAGFQAAYDESGEPTDLFNLGRIHEEIGDLPAALEYYERFVEQPHLELQERRLAADRIEVLRVLVPQETEGAPPQPVAAQPAGDVLPRSERTMIVAGSVLLGVGAALAGAGGIAFGIRGRRADRTVDELNGGMNPERLMLAGAEDVEARGRNSNVLQATFLATGGALAIAGGTVLVLGLVRRAKTSRAAVQAAVSPTHAFISTTWRF